MSKKCRWSIYTGLAILLGIIVLFLVKIICFSGIFFPLIELNGNKQTQVEVNTQYVDEGAKARYRFQTYNDAIDIHSNLDTTRLGVYTITYTFDKYNTSVEREVEVVDTTSPVIKLLGGDSIRVFVNTTFEDPGYSAFDNYDGDLSEQIQVDSTQLDMKSEGTYTVMYTVNDTSGNTTQLKRSVDVVNDPTLTKVYYNHDEYDNSSEEWWFRKSEQHLRTTAAREENFLKQYDAYFLGPDEKTIYLTFDEGGNDITYIKQIADVLNENKVVATFFLTRNYIKDNPDFIKDLVAHGHVIGNHSWHHYDMPTLANAKDIDAFVLEITETEKTYMQVTGEPMKKVFRFPKGGMSERSLKIVQDLGYSNYFWSHAYYDYAQDVSKEEALQTLMDHYHNGAIYLLHPSNAGNYKAMDAFIKNMIQEGYQFDTVDSIPKTNK